MKPVGPLLCTILLMVLSLTIGNSRSANAQDSVNISGEAFLDYFYFISSLNGETDWENGFNYRRARLTADATISEQFSARIRMETIGLLVNDNGIPEPFVKDLFLKWKNALGDGHNLVMGIASTVAWGPVEKVWGYRSVARTLQHRAGLHSSRDMGVKADGPVALDGKLRYSVQIGNANGVRAENDKYKRVYGQLEYYPTPSVTITVGGNYERIEDGYAYNINGFAGFESDRFRVGGEGYYHPTVFDDGRATEDRYGGSGFVVYDVSMKHSIILRADFVERPDGALLASEVFAVAGIAFRPQKNVQFIPHLRYLNRDGAENDRITGLFTLWFKF